MSPDRDLYETLASLKQPALGKRIRRLRKERGLSQASLAKLAGISKSLVSHIEWNPAKNPRPETRRAIAEALDGVQPVEAPERPGLFRGMKQPHLGRNIRRLREEKWLSQPALAEAASLPQMTVQSIEDGKSKNPRPETLRAIAKALDVVQPDKALEPFDLKQPHLGRKIRRLREEKGLLRSSLANRASVPYTTVRSIETGQTIHPRPETLRAIAEALDGVQPVEAPELPELFRGMKQPRLGKRIRRARHEKALSLEALAAAAGLERLTVQKVETAATVNPRSETLRAIADALDGVQPVETPELPELFRDLKPSDLGKRIRRLRNAKGLSQPALANAASTSQSVVSRIECAQVTNPSPETLRAIADALGNGERTDQPQTPILPSTAAAAEGQAQGGDGKRRAKRRGGGPKPKWDHFYKEFHQQKRATPKLTIRDYLSRYKAAFPNRPCPTYEQAKKAIQNRRR